METVDFVLYTHIKRCCNRTFLLITVNVDVAVGSAVGQLMDQCVITVECKNDRFVVLFYSPFSACDNRLTGFSPKTV